MGSRGGGCGVAAPRIPRGLATGTRRLAADFLGSRGAVKLALLTRLSALGVGLGWWQLGRRGVVDGAGLSPWFGKLGVRAFALGGVRGGNEVGATNGMRTGVSRGRGGLTPTFGGGGVVGRGAATF